MLVQSRANFLIDLNGRQLREVFKNLSSDQRDEFILERSCSLDLHRWSVIMIPAFIAKSLQGTMVTNQRIDVDEGTGEALVSASIWMDVAQYFNLRALSTESFSGVSQQGERSVLTAFDRASASFHFPARTFVYENGNEVGTLETEERFILGSNLMLDGNKINPDMSDCHGDPEELSNVELFNNWFRERLKLSVVP